MKSLILLTIGALSTIASAQESTSWVTSTIYSTTTIQSGTSTVTVEDYDYTSSTLPEFTPAVETSTTSPTTSPPASTSTTTPTSPTPTTSNPAGSVFAFTTISYFSTVLSTTAWTTYFTVPVLPEPTPATPISGFVTRLRQSGSATATASVGFAYSNSTTTTSSAPATTASPKLTSTSTTFTTSTIFTTTFTTTTATTLPTPTPSAFALTALRINSSTPYGSITTYNTRFYIGLPIDHTTCTNCTIGLPALFTNNNSTMSMSPSNKAVFIGPAGGLRVLDGGAMPNGSLATGFEVEEGENGSFDVTSASGGWFACPRPNLGTDVFQVFVATEKANVRGCYGFIAIGEYDA